MPPGVNPELYDPTKNFHHGAQQPPSFQQPQSFGAQQPGHYAVPPQQQPHQHQSNIPQSGSQQNGPNHGHAQPVLHSSNIQQEKQHIAEHLDIPLDTSKMNEQELQFHYFKMHDSDNNNKLDGCELIKSLIHWHEMHERLDLTDELFAETIDDILSRLDFNLDGYIDIIEYGSAVSIEQVKEFHQEYEAAKFKVQTTVVN